MVAPIKVSIVSGRSVVGSEIVNCLKSTNWIHLTGPCITAAAIEKLEAVRPNVVLIDCGQTERTTLGLLSRIVERFPKVRIASIVDSINYSIRFAAIRMGVSALLLRPFTARELLDAVHVAADGGLYLTPTLVRFLFEDALHIPAGHKTSHQPLTPREREILKLQAQGLPYKRIADCLHISEHTVSNHLYTIRQKLGVHSAIEAINIVYRWDDPPTQ